VTNVYTGIVTNNSPRPEDTNYAFADCFADTWTSDYLIDTPESMAGLTVAFTEFINKMNSNTDTAQWTAAPPTDGHARFFDMIVETNYSFKEFKHWHERASHAERGRLCDEIKRYIFHAIGSHIDVDIPFNLSVDSEVRYPRYNEMLREIASQTGAELSAAVTGSGLSCRDVSPQMSSSLTMRPDVFGRTYFIIRFTENAAQHMMASARFTRDLPPHTQSMANAILSGRYDTRLTDRELQQPTSSTVRKYIGLVYDRKRLGACTSDEALRLPSDQHMSSVSKLTVWTHAYAKRYVDQMRYISQIGIRSYDKSLFMYPYGPGLSRSRVREALMTFTDPISSWFVQ
jgi:hypothetical protein